MEDIGADLTVCPGFFVFITAFFKGMPHPPVSRPPSPNTRFTKLEKYGLEREFIYEEMLRPFPSGYSLGVDTD